MLQSQGAVSRQTLDKYTKLLHLNYKEKNQMPRTGFTDEITLAEQAENLGRRALTMGLIPSFVVRHFPDSWEFYIPDETANQLMPEEAYLHLKQLVEPID